MHCTDRFWVDVVISYALHWQVLSWCSYKLCTTLTGFGIWLTQSKFCAGFDRSSAQGLSIHHHIWATRFLTCSLPSSAQGEDLGYPPELALLTAPPLNRSPRRLSTYTRGHSLRRSGPPSSEEVPGMDVSPYPLMWDQRDRLHPKEQFIDALNDETCASGEKRLIWFLPYSNIRVGRYRFFFIHDISANIYRDFL